MANTVNCMFRVFYHSQKIYLPLKLHFSFVKRTKGRNARTTHFWVSNTMKKEDGSHLLGPLTVLIYCTRDLY